MFYTFSQNNTGGSFDIDEDLAEYVIIEAPSARQANETATRIGIYFNGCNEGIDCDCCGDRWCPVDEGDADETPLIYATPVDKMCKAGLGDGCRIHYIDGSVRTVEFKEKELWDKN